MIKKKVVAVITESDSDILQLLKSNDINTVVFKPGEIQCQSFDDFYSVAILGGVSEKPVMLNPRERVLIEEQINKGKKVFAEYCASIGHIYYGQPVRTRFERLVFCPKDEAIDGVGPGDLMDDQCGMRIKPYPDFCSHNTPILQYVMEQAHSNVGNLEQVSSKIEDRALWFNSDNLLISSFRLANYNRARFAPKTKFKGVIKYILEWLTGDKIDMGVVEEYYKNGVYSSEVLLTGLIEESVDKAMNWFDKAGIVLNGGKDGVIEGLSTEVYPEGTQRLNTIIRTDCVGEVSMAYFMYGMLKENEDYRKISDRLASICFDYMQCKEPGDLYGMVRWTQEAWGVCYQDDVARAIIPQMLKCFYTGEKQYLKECSDALDFLVRTTGTDGTRPFRTDNIKLDKETMEKLKNEPADFPSAHYNGYYYAALLLGYKLTGKDSFRDVAVKGINTIMTVYPDTIREQSQTEEYCRLILPLSWLYWVTGEEKHREWLYRVTAGLQKFKHSSGAYLEWDEGYKASMRNKAGEGESSLLASNGDPVVDLLYSNNWLPVGFMQAYFVTGDMYFKNLWEENARFLVSAQIHSQDRMIDGAWARGFDVEFKEVFGSPADAGWGPWAVESGWTMGEITAGLMMGLIHSKLKNFYQRG